MSDKTKRTAEREAAVALANRILDRPSADPDDDLAILARQLLRASERQDIARELAEAVLTSSARGTESFWHRAEGAELLVLARRFVKVAGAKPVRHGYDCPKVAHGGTGYLHGPLDDQPYDADGVAYCGRCHVALEAAEPREE